MRLRQSAVCLALLTASCGGDGDGATRPESTPATPVAGTQILVEGPVSPGSYITVFEPKMSLSFTEEGWGVDEDVETFLGLFTQGTESDKVNRCNLAFLSPSQAYDPRNPDKLIPLPADFVGWLQSHPHLDVGKPEPVTVGGVGGSRVDVMVASIPVRHQVNCPFGPCVPIVPFELHGRSEPYPYLEEDAGQMTILEVGGRTVIIDRPRTSSAACDIQRFRPSIQELLGSIEFVST